MRALAALALTALIAAPAAVPAAAPTGAELAVNTTTAGDQGFPGVCAGANGTAWVVWESAAQDGSGNAVVARRVVDGAAAGDELAVNTTTAGDQQAPAVACTPAGEALIVWESRAPGGEDFDIVARAFAADGTPRGGEQRLHDDAAGRQSQPAVCAAGDGTFVAAWQHETSADGAFGIIARRLDGDGTPQGEPLAVGAAREGSQTHPALACAPDGGFVIAWQQRIAHDDGILVARYGADDRPLGEVVPVDGGLPGGQRHASVALAASGAFLVAWESNAGEDGDGYGVFARRFGADGVPAGTAFSLAAVTAFDQEKPALAATARGFAAAWSGADDGDDYGVFLRQFDLLGRPLAGERVVNTHLAGVQGAFSEQPHPLALAGDGDALLVAWHSGRTSGATQDGDGYGVVARRAEAIAACSGDCNADFAVTIDELVGGVTLALSDTPPADCPAIDLDGDARVVIAELISAVAAALNGCPEP